MAEILRGPDELEARCAALRERGWRVAFVDGSFAVLTLETVRTLREARRGADLLAVGVSDDSAELVAELACVDFVCRMERETVAGFRERLDAPPRARERVLLSWHRDRRVFRDGGRYVKQFSHKRERDAELRRLFLLKSIGVGVPEILECPGSDMVTAPIPGRPLDEIVAGSWAAMARKQRNRLIERVAALCRRIRDAGFDWPDLVSYHVFVGAEKLYVLDPARLRHGKLDLSPLFWSAEEPTVSHADRLRFWRAYSGPKTPPPRIRAIGHRGRFRPYRWVLARDRVRACPRWDRFVDAGATGFRSADEVADHPDLRVRRELADRTNAELGDLVVKIHRDPEQARREWENHRRMLAAGFRVPMPAVGGVLADGRGLYSTRKLEGLAPLDSVWSGLDARRVVIDVADLARRLHACGLVHKDLYLNHIFAGEEGGDLTLIDLARVEKSRSQRLRIKDLAALYVSARPLVPRTLLLRGLRRYGGDKRLARAVLRKAARMARHVPRKLRDGSHSLSTPCTSA